MRCPSLTHNSKQPARQQGAAIVEFALVLTLLITLMAGIFEFGRAFWYYDTLVKATRDGARFMSVADNTSIETSVGLAKTQVFNAVNAAGVPDFELTNVDITCFNAALTATVGCTNSTVIGGVTVQITAYEMTIGQFIPFLIGASSNYSATLSPHTTMRYMPEVL